MLKAKVIWTDLTNDIEQEYEDEVSYDEYEVMMQNQACGIIHVTSEEFI